MITDITHGKKPSVVTDIIEKAKNIIDIKGTLLADEDGTSLTETWRIINLDKDYCLTAINELTYDFCDDDGWKRKYILLTPDDLDALMRAKEELDK